MQPEDLAAALRAALPPELHAGAAALARLLADVANGALAADVAAARISGDTALAALVAALAGQRLQADRSLVAFGAGSQIGDVTIGDVAGGDMVKLNVVVQESPRTTRRLLFVLGGIALVVVLAAAVLVQNVLRGSQQLRRAQLAIGADVLENMTSLDFRIGFVESALADLPNQNAAATTYALFLKQQRASLQQALNSRPIAGGPNESLLQVLVDSRADPTVVRSFYTNLVQTQNDADTLLGELDSLGLASGDALRQERLRHLDLARRSLRADSQIAYLWGLWALRTIDAPIDNVQAGLSAVKNLAPKQLVTQDEIAAALQRETDTLKQLQQERVALAGAAAAGLVDATAIKPDDTWDKVVGKAIALRKRGDIEQSVAAFRRYGEMFAAADPTAAQYSQVAQAFTRQAAKLGLESAVYVYDIEQGSAGQRAGLQVGDIVVEIAGQPTSNASTFEQAVSSVSQFPFDVSIRRLLPDGTFAEQMVSIPALPMGISIMPI